MIYVGEWPCKLELCKPEQEVERGLLWRCDVNRKSLSLGTRKCKGGWVTVKTSASLEVWSQYMTLIRGELWLAAWLQIRRKQRRDGRRKGLFNYKGKRRCLANLFTTEGLMLCHHATGYGGWSLFVARKEKKRVSLDWVGGVCTFSECVCLSFLGLMIVPGWFCQ